MPGTYAAGAVAYHGETLALSTTLASLGVPKNYQQALILNPSNDFRMNLNPALIDVRFFNESASPGVEYEQGGGTGDTLLRDLTDRTLVGAGGTGTVLDSSTTSDFLYLCFSENVSGFRVDMSASLNGTAATLTVEYRKNDNTWADLSATDGTRTGGDTTLGQDGDVTWTAVTDWKSAQLIGPQGIVSNDTVPVGGSTKEEGTATGFWCRMSWSNAIDSDTEIDELWALNFNTDRGFFRAGVEYAVSLDRRVIGSIEAILTASTDTLEITWVKT